MFFFHSSSPSRDDELVVDQRSIASGLPSGVSR